MNSQPESTQTQQHLPEFCTDIQSVNVNYPPLNSNKMHNIVSTTNFT